MTTTGHACPPEGSGTMPCCHRTPFEVPRTDKLTAFGPLVTCRGPLQVCGAEPDGGEHRCSLRHGHPGPHMCGGCLRPFTDGKEG